MAATAVLTSRKAMLRSVLWTFVSALWLLIGSLKLQSLRSAGGYVSPFRYGIVILWAVVVAFCITNVLRDLKRMREEAVGKVS